jgi:hypothetical protein
LVGDAPRFSGKAAWGVLAPSARVSALADPPVVRMWLGPRQHLVSYPISGGRLLKLAGVLPVGGDAEETWTREGDELDSPPCSKAGTRMRARSRAYPKRRRPRASSCATHAERQGEVA